MKPLQTIPFLLLFSLLSSCLSPENDEKWWTEEDKALIIQELMRTTSEVADEIRGLTISQVTFRESPDRWNILEIIEHLEMQNQLHYREISITANSPQYLEYRQITDGMDQHFIKYATDTVKGQANWFLQPKGKFCDIQSAQEAFMKARKELLSYVVQTPADLRKQFTFRTPVYEQEFTDLKIGEVRDLHQLLLTGIAHTDRHLRQIRNVKRHKNYPSNP